MNAIAFFYNDSTDCIMAVRNNRGGLTYTLFERVSDMVNYCRDNDIEAEIVTEG